MQLLFISLFGQVLSRISDAIWIDRKYGITLWQAWTIIDLANTLFSSPLAK